MNFQSILLLIILIVIVAFAVRGMVKNHKRGCTCCGYDCSNCSEKIRKKE